MDRRAGQRGAATSSVARAKRRPAGPALRAPRATSTSPNAATRRGERGRAARRGASSTSPTNVTPAAARRPSPRICPTGTRTPRGPRRCRRRRRATAWGASRSRGIERRRQRGLETRGGPRALRGAGCPSARRVSHDLPGQRAGIVRVRCQGAEAGDASIATHDCGARPSAITSATVASSPKTARAREEPGRFGAAVRASSASAAVRAARSAPSAAASTSAPPPCARWTGSPPQRDRLAPPGPVGQQLERRRAQGRARSRERQVEQPVGAERRGGVVRTIAGRRLSTPASAARNAPHRHRASALDGSDRVAPMPRSPGDAQLPLCQLDRDQPHVRLSSPADRQHDARVRLLASRPRGSSARRHAAPPFPRQPSLQAPSSKQRTVNPLDPVRAGPATGPGRRSRWRTDWCAAR